MSQIKHCAAVLVLAFAGCIETNPGYLGPTTGETTTESTGATTTGGTTETGATTGPTTELTTGTSGGGTGSASGVVDSCGDGVIDAGEACDDGRNGDQDDGCTDLCTLPTCGDDFLQPSLGEECDDGIFNVDDGACTPGCAAARCGDGFVRAGYESCDDGNQVGEDGCEADCTTLSVVDLALAGDFTCALLSHGKVRCWGYNIIGQLGLGDTDNRGDDPGELPTAYVELGGTAIAIAAGQWSVCAALDNGLVRCWGDNMCGQLGVGNVDGIGWSPGQLPGASTPIGESPRVLAAGVDFFCAATLGGDVRCWGSNYGGQLGLQFPHQYNPNFGDEPDELPTPRVYIQEPVQAVAVGANHTCALSTTGEVYCWGVGASGQLGSEDIENICDDGEEPPVHVKVDANAADVVQIAAGGGHTCVLRGSQQVRCWGAGAQGQLGYEDESSIGDYPGTMPPPDVPLGGDVLQIAAGFAHNCALMQGGTVRCWGSNMHGQLGLALEGNIGDSEGEMPPPDVPLGGLASAIFAGGNTTCALLVDGQVRCWGENSHGQLGIGSTEMIGDDETPDMAPATPVLP